MVWYEWVRGILYHMYAYGMHLGNMVPDVNFHVSSVPTFFVSTMASRPRVLTPSLF